MYSMDELFVRKDVLRDIVSVRGDLVTVDEGVRIPAMLSQFRHKETRQRIFCILLTENNLCCIMNTDIDILPKPYATKGSRNDTSLTVSRLDGKVLVLTFNSKFTFLNWQKCLGEVIAEVQCCDAMKPLSSGRLSATRMSRCISLCRVLTRNVALVQQVKRLRAVRHKINETMKTILAQEGRLNAEDVRKVKTSCGFIRTVFPSLRVDPDLLFLTEQLQGDKHSQQDLQSICRLLLSVEQEDRAEFLRMVRRSAPSPGSAAFNTGKGSPVSKPVPINHRPTVPSSLNSSQSSRKGSKEGGTGSTRRSPCKSAGRNHHNRNISMSGDKDHGLSDPSCDSASPVTPTVTRTPSSVSRRQLETRVNAKKTVTWDESVQSRERPRAPRSTTKRHVRAPLAVSPVREAPVHGDVPILATNSTAAAIVGDKENCHQERNAPRTDAAAVGDCIVPAPRGKEREMQHSPIAKPVPTMVVSATSVAGVARAQDVHAEPGGQQPAVAQVDQAVERAVPTRNAESGNSSGGDFGHGAQGDNRDGCDPRHPVSARAQSPQRSNTPAAAAAVRGTAAGETNRSHQDGDPHQHRPVAMLARCLSGPMLGMALLLAVIVLCTTQLAPLLSVNYSATHFTPGAGYSSLTVSLGSGSGAATAGPLSGSRGPLPKEDPALRLPEVIPSASTRHPQTVPPDAASGPSLAVKQPELGEEGSPADIDRAARTGSLGSGDSGSGASVLHLQASFPQGSGSGPGVGKQNADRSRTEMLSTAVELIGPSKRRRQSESERAEGAVVAGSALRRVMNVLFAPLRWLKGTVRALAGWLQGGRKAGGRRATTAAKPLRPQHPRMPVTA